MLNTFSVFNFAKKYNVFLFSLHSPHHLPSLSLQLFWLQLSFTNTGHWGCTIIVKMLLIQSHPLFPPCVSRHIVELNFPSVALHHLCYLYHSLIKLSLFSVLMVRSQITAENLYNDACISNFKFHSLSVITVLKVIQCCHCHIMIFFCISDASSI